MGHVTPRNVVDGLGGWAPTCTGILLGQRALLNSHRRVTAVRTVLHNANRAMRYTFRVTLSFMQSGSERVKDLSKALFGNRHQLEIACAIADEKSGIFTATTLSAATGVPHNLVGPILSKFAGIGTITVAPNVRSSSSKYYSRNECDFWGACVSILNSMGSELPAPYQLVSEE